LHELFRKILNNFVGKIIPDEAKMYEKSELKWRNSPYRKIIHLTLQLLTLGKNIEKSTAKFDSL
jgi:hypothetical protein